jgi:hypothetical protein
MVRNNRPSRTHLSRYASLFGWEIIEAPFEVRLVTDFSAGSRRRWADDGHQQQAQPATPPRRRAYTARPLANRSLYSILGILTVELTNRLRMA